jgi:hypothetical protein
VITLSLDISKIDKARFKKAKKRDGTEAQYLELVLFETEGSEYGDYIVKQQLTKEERQAGNVQLPILGNGKIWDKRGGQRTAAPAVQPTETDSSDVPF